MPSARPRAPTGCWLNSAHICSPMACRLRAALSRSPFHTRSLPDVHGCGVPTAGKSLRLWGLRPAGLWRCRSPGSPNNAGRRWLATIAAGVVHEDAIGPKNDGPLLSWIGPRPFTPSEIDNLRQAARFAAAPLAALAARATLTAALEAYLGRRSAARVLAAPLSRDIGETIQAALLYADLRGFTALSDNNPPAVVIAALDAWFDRIAGAVHAFGGEVLKFIGDGVLAIFPVVEGDAAGRLRCRFARGVRRPRRHGTSRWGSGFGKGLPALPFGAALHLGEILGAISAQPIAWISLPSAPRSIWSAGWRGFADRSARRSWCLARLPPRPRRRWSRLERMRSAVSHRHALVFTLPEN